MSVMGRRKFRFLIFEEEKLQLSLKQIYSLKSCERAERKKSNENIPVN